MDRLWYVPDEGSRRAHAEACGLTIRQLRQDRGAKVSEVATYTGLAKSYISMVERGERIPSPDVARKIAAAVGADPEEAAMSWTGAQAILEKIIKAAPSHVKQMVMDRLGAVA